MGYGQALSLSLPLTLSPNRLKWGDKEKVRSPQVRSPHAFHQTPLYPPTSFSLSLLFLPFVFRGSCCNSADHQQLPFQRHLTLPNPRPSLHPDTANATPPPPTPRRVTPRGRQSQSPPPSPRPRHVHRVTPFQIQALPSWASVLLRALLCPLATIWLMATRDTKSEEEREEVSVCERKKVTVRPQQGSDWEINKNIPHTAEWDEPSFNMSLSVDCLTGLGESNVKSWQATGTRPNGCLIAEDNGCCRLSGCPPVMFNMRRAMQTGCYSFVYQFRGLDSHRGSNKGIITIYPPFSVWGEEALRAMKTSSLRQIVSNVDTFITGKLLLKRYYFTFVITFVILLYGSLLHLEYSKSPFILIFRFKFAYPLISSI